MRASQSFREIVERDQRGEYKDWEDFDGTLWVALCDLIDFDSPQSVTELPEPVWIYFATRLLEWEVGNGGFAQAAMNISEWFEMAAKGNEILGKHQLADFIREASKLASKESERIQEAYECGLESAFEYFSEDVFESFESQLDDIGWWCGQDRILYVRANIESFMGLDSLHSGDVPY